MKNLIFLLSLVIIGCSCNRNTKQPLQLEYLESSWISSDSTCWNIADGFIISDIFDESISKFLIFRYKMEKDTLFLTPVRRDYSLDGMLKFQIVRLAQNELDIKYINKGSRNIYFAFNGFSGKLKPDSTYSYRRYNAFKNNERIKSLKFSARHGMGYCPTLNLIVNKDSVLFFKGDQSVINEGFGQCKLTKREFAKVETMFNRVGLNDFRLYQACPGATVYSIYIETNSRKIIECSGVINSNTSDFKRFIVFLSHIERTLKIQKIDKFKDPVTYRKAKQLLDF